MNDDERIALFRPKVEAELDELTVSSAGTSDDRKPVEFDQQSVGRLSRMDSMQMQAMANAVEKRRQNRIAMLRHTLRRMDEGEFGYCAACGEAISLKRLEIDPVVTRCVGCAR